MSTETYTEELTARIAELEAEVSALKSAVSRGPELMSSYRVVNMAEAKAMNFEDAADFDPEHDSGWAVIRYEGPHSMEFVGRDGGEPEDQLLVRDWAWVVEALNREATRALLGINKPSPACPAGPNCNDPGFERCAAWPTPAVPETGGEQTPAMSDRERRIRDEEGSPYVCGYAGERNCGVCAECFRMEGWFAALAAKEERDEKDAAPAGSLPKEGTEPVTGTGYTRAELADATDTAHHALHRTPPDVEAAHDALHSAGGGKERVGYAARDPEAPQSDRCADCGGTWRSCNCPLGTLVEDAQSEAPQSVPASPVVGAPNVAPAIAKAFEFLAFQLGEPMAGDVPRPGELRMLRRDGGWIVGRYVCGANGSAPLIGLLPFGDKPLSDEHMLAALDFATAVVHTSVTRTVSRAMRISRGDAEQILSSGGRAKDGRETMAMSAPAAEAKPVRAGQAWQFDHGVEGVSGQRVTLTERFTGTPPGYCRWMTLEKIAVVENNNTLPNMTLVSDAPSPSPAVEASPVPVKEPQRCESIGVSVNGNRLRCILLTNSEGRHPGYAHGNGLLSWSDDGAAPVAPSPVEPLTLAGIMERAPGATLGTDKRYRYMWRNQSRTLFLEHGEPFTFTRQPNTGELTSKVVETWADLASHMDWLNGKGP